MLLLGRRRRRFEKKKNNFFQLTTTTTDEKALFLTTTTSRENERFAICDLLPPPTSRRNTCASLAEETRTRTTVSAMKEGKGRETERNDGVFPTKRPTLPPPPGFDEVVVEGQGKVLQRENEVFYNRPQWSTIYRGDDTRVSKRRKEEYENETYQKTRRGKGMYNKVPKESKIIEYLVSEEERERMFASKKEVPKKSENDAKKDDGTKQKEWIEVKPGTFRWQVAGEEVKETIPKPTKVEEKKNE